MKKLRIIGIHDNHNASVCLLEDGTIRSSVQEERIVREKNYTGFPYKGLQWILDSNNLTTDDVDVFAFGQKHNPTQYTTKERLEWYKSSGGPKSKAIDLLRETPFYNVYKGLAKRTRLRQMQKAGIPAEKAVFIDHHLAHASAAYYGSFYKKYGEKILVLTLDGGGDGLCSSVYIGDNGFLKKIAETEEGNSIASIYARTTFYLGMTPLEHEYKLMGMAPYAKQEYYKRIYEKLRRLIYVDGLNFKRRLFFSTFETYPILKKIYELERFDNICGALQEATEELVLTWVSNALRKTGIKNLALGGGLFMNVKVNKRIMELTNVDNLFVFPSCGDESCAEGAAYQAYASMCKDTGEEVKGTNITDLYKGPEYSHEEIEGKIQEVASHNRDIEYTRDRNIENTIADMLGDNKIVASFGGKVEWGARALGNRSILANGSFTSNIRYLNKAVKNRDFWMPFAPSILEDRQHDYIVNPKSIPAPYMTLAFDTKEKRNEIVAAIHPEDWTARPQTVSENINLRYFTILRKYEEKTGYGGLLNTSFNLHGEPIVCSPKDALKTFTNSGLKYLAMGDFLVSKTN